MQWQRFANPRAIPIDKRRIASLAQEIEAEIAEQATRGDRRPLGDLVIGRWLFSIKPVGHNKPRLVPIYVQATETQSPYYVVGGGTGKTPNGKDAIVVYINGSMKQGKLYHAAKAQAIRRQLYSTLSHEITHVADVFRSKKLKGIDPRGGLEDERLSEYYNLPSEVKAYMREVVDETSEHFDRWPTLVEHFGPSKALHYLMGMSPTWAKVSPYWTEKNRRRVIQAVVRDLEN